MNSKRRWAEHVTGSVKRSNAYRLLLESVKEEDSLEYLGVDRRIVLK
jgi:hypothetical protein